MMQLDWPACPAEGYPPSEALDISMPPGVALEWVATIDSTNAALMRRARAGCLQPTLLVAKHQSAGRGRRGHTWHNAGGLSGGPMAGLMFSLGLPWVSPDADGTDTSAKWSGLSGLSLAVGLSLATSLHPDIQIKWPNDLWWQGRKLGGILIETAGARRYLVVGVGLNILVPDCAAAKTFATAPAGLTELMPDATALRALARVATPLWQTLHTFLQCGFAPFQSDFHARDALRDTPVILDNGVHGVARGVDATGAWQVQTAGSMVSLTSTALSARPIGVAMPFAGSQRIRATWHAQDDIECCV